jgi:hypothetical protein
LILHPDSHLAEPITFEILRHATPAEARQLTQPFQALPTFATPPVLCPGAAELVVQVAEMDSQSLK